MKKQTKLLSFLVLLLPFALALILAGCTGNNGDVKATASPEATEKPIMTVEPKPSDFVDKPSDYYTELYRQQLHFSPEKGWINDPNGMVYYNGEYHLFYQYDGYDPAGGAKSWGHSVSTDLIHWEELDVAIPCTNSYQIWSGSCVVDKNNVSGLFNETGSGLVAFFTKLSSRQEQSVAYSDDNGRTWKLYNNGTPVLKYNDDPLGKADKTGGTGFRDPKVIWNEDANCWIMVVAGDALRIYSSTDLLNWKFESLYKTEQTVDGVKIPSIYTECPDLYKMKIEGTNEYRWVLCLGGRSYFVGDLRKVEGTWYFLPETSAIEMNFGPDAYAAQTYFGAPDGRIIMINWMSDVGNGAKQLTWTPTQCGSMTIQTELKLVNTENGPRISMLPIEEMKTLEMPYSGYVTFEHTEGSSEDVLNSNYLFNDEMYKLNFEVANGRLELNLFGGDVTVKYSTVTGVLSVDRSKTGFGGTYTTIIPAHDDKMSFIIYVDVASIEIYADNGLYVGSFLIYGSPNHSLIMAFSDLGDGFVKGTYVKLNSIWRDLRWTEVESEDFVLPDCAFVKGKSSDVVIGTGRLFTNCSTEWEITVGGDVAEILSVSDISVKINCLKEGSFTLKATRNGESITKEYTVSDIAFKTNITEWKIVGGTWDNTTAAGLVGITGGDGFYTAMEKVTGNFTLKVKCIPQTAIALGILIGIKSPDAPNSESIVVNFDFNANNFRIFHFNGHGADDVKAVTFSKCGVKPVKNTTYEIELRYEDGKLTYIFDGNVIFDSVSVNLQGSYVGVMNYAGQNTYKEFTLERN